MDIWQSIMLAAAGVIAFAALCAVALAVLYVLVRWQPRLLGLPGAGDTVLVWAHQPPALDPAELRDAIEAQCPVQPLSENAIAVRGPLDLRALADEINTKLARPA